MKTGFVWYRDAVPIDGWCKYYLGINNKTGRLQWCPDMTCYKYLIIISSAMLPVAVIFVLLLHMDETLSLHDWKTEINTVTNSIVKDLGDRISRCIVVRIGISENLDLEEKGLLKDVRTSFIPPESVYFPPNCGLDNEGTDDYFAINTHTFFLEPIDRQKRSFTNLTDENSNDESDDNNMEVGFLAIGLNLNTKMNMSKLSDHNIEVVTPLDVSHNSTFGFHSFWKSEGTQENIRLTQSEIMKKYMDTTIDPCTDFYQYACGNWAKLNPIPKDKAGYDTFEMLRESLDLVLRDLLLEDTQIQIQNFEKEKGTSNQKVPNISENLRYGTDNNKLYAIRARKTIIKKRETLNKIIRQYEFSKFHNERIRRQLFNPQIHNKETDAETKARNLYASCMNSEILEERGIQPILDLLQSLGGWPVLNPQWNEKEFDWLGLIAKLRLYNNDIFIVEWVGPDIKNSDKNIIQFDQTSLGLPTRDYFLHESNFQYLKAYKEFMEAIMNILGASYDVSKKTAFEVVQFEIELARITSSSEDRANVSILYKRMTLHDLHELVPGIDWRRYLAIVQERSVNESEIVVIYAIEYMEQLVVLLSKTNSTIISNYLMWRFVRHRINNLDDRFQEAKQKFFHVLFGREQCPPRWKNCVGQVNSNMGMALGAMFVRKYFDENSKADTLKMTHELQEAFRDILNSTNWLDDETKRLAELKVNSMSLKIGYPDFILSKNQLNKKYEGLIIDPNNYFENTLNVLHHVTRIEQMKLMEVVNKTVWQTAPAIVNAYYSRNKNQIMFPAGILQPPFYHRHFPRSLNYGGIGIVIGHELTHGFDDKGRLFDRDGNIHKWWSDHAINGFHERARCLISQYANYTVSEVGIAVDGESTQGENIADNGGIRQAFHAYQNWLENNNSPDILESEILPGLNMTSKQLFFLNFAQVWCGAMRPEAMRNKLKTAVHSPGKFRVIGTISNSLDFAREFQCQPGSPMNPVHKCSVW